MQQVDHVRKVWVLFVAAIVYGALVVVVFRLYREEITSYLLTEPALSVLLLFIPGFTTWVVWRAFRRFEILRSWLVLKVVGSCVFIGAIAASWVFNLSGEAMLIMISFGFVLWGLGVAQLLKRTNN